MNDRSGLEAAVRYGREKRGVIAPINKIDLITNYLKLAIMSPVIIFFEFGVMPLSNTWNKLCKRRFDRRTCNIPAVLRQGTLLVPCRIIDFSEGGARLTFDTIYSGLLTGRDWILEEPTIGTIAVRLVWQGSDELGTQFEVRSRSHAKLRALFDQIDACNNGEPEKKLRVGQ